MFSSGLVPAGLPTRRHRVTPPSADRHTVHRAGHRYHATVTTGLDQELLTRLSADQKVALLAGADTWHTAGFDDPPVAAIRMSDGPAGVRGTSWSGPASASFPCGAALGATWDPDLVEEIGRALGREAHSKSANVVLAPTVNLHRTPVGGRNFECYSEDPILTAEIAVAYVRGLQAERVAACIKHFVGNDTEFERMTISSEIDERTFRELYLVPFEAAVRRADVRCVMSGYNRLNGTFCSEHHWLLTELLRDEWGFDGVVVSDWFGTHSAAASLLAGLDVEMPGPPRERGEHLPRGARPAARSPSDDLDRSVRPGARPRRLDRRRRHRHDGGDRRRSRDEIGDPPGDGAGDGAAEERGWGAAAGVRRPPGGADRSVRQVRPTAGRWQRQGAPGSRARTAGGVAGARARRHVRTGRIDRQVPADRARRLHAEPQRRDGRDGGGGRQPPGVVLGQGARRRDRRQGVHGADRRHVRPRRVRSVGARRARRRSGVDPDRRRRRRRADRVAPWRGVLRHGQPGGPRHRRARGGPALRARPCDYPASERRARARAGRRRPPRARSTTRSPGRPPSPPTPTWPSSSSAPTTTGRPRARTARRWPCRASRTTWWRPWRRRTRTPSSCSTPARR